jgi:hypothetical protein
MTETVEQPTSSSENPLPVSGYGQYQRQTVTLNNTIGMMLMSVIAFTLLVSLLRQQARFHELEEKILNK